MIWTLCTSTGLKPGAFATSQPLKGIEILFKLVKITKSLKKLSYYYSSITMGLRVSSGPVA